MNFNFKRLKEVFKKYYKSYEVYEVVKEKDSNKFLIEKENYLFNIDVNLQTSNDFSDTIRMTKLGETDSKIYKTFTDVNLDLYRLIKIENKELIIKLDGVEYIIILLEDKEDYYLLKLKSK